MNVRFQQFLWFFLLYSKIQTVYLLNEECLNNLVILLFSFCFSCLCFDFSVFFSCFYSFFCLGLSLTFFLGLLGLFRLVETWGLKRYWNLVFKLNLSLIWKVFCSVFIFFYFFLSLASPLKVVSGGDVILPKLKINKVTILTCAFHLRLDKGHSLHIDYCFRRICLPHK